MSHVPHPADDPLVRRPAREDKSADLTDEAEKNLSSTREPSGQGSDKPGFREAPLPELTADGQPGIAGAPASGETEPPRNLLQTLHEYQIESEGPLGDEARRQLEQNIVPQENHP